MPVNSSTVNIVKSQTKTLSATGGCAPRHLRLASSASGNPLPKFLDPPLPREKKRCGRKRPRPNDVSGMCL